MGIARKSLSALAAAAMASLFLLACGGDESAGTASLGARETTGQKEATPALARRGKASPQSTPFRGSKGSMASLPEYGTEASAAQRAAAGKVVDRYLAAAASGRWGQACAYLAPDLRAQIRQATYGRRAPPSGWCAGAFPAYLRASGQPPGELRRYDSLQVASLRVKADAAFALIRDQEGGLWVLLKRADGEWWVQGPVPQSL
jgi:hypothetical protein